MEGDKMWIVSQLVNNFQHLNLHVILEMEICIYFSRISTFFTFATFSWREWDMNILYDLCHYLYTSANT